MLNEKYIFWETEIALKIGDCLMLCGSYSEWLDLNAQINRHVALNSSQPLTIEQNSKLLSLKRVIFSFNKEDRESKYIPGVYFHEPSTSYIQSMWKLAVSIADVLGPTLNKWIDYHNIQPEIVRKAHVWYREKNGKIELLTREQFDAGVLDHEFNWSPVLLNAVLWQHFDNKVPFDRVPADLLIPDKTEYDLKELDELQKAEEGLMGFFKPIAVVIQKDKTEL